MENLMIEAYKEGDETELNNLFNNVFKINRSLKEWEWKFLECPIISRPFIILAKEGGKIVGGYSCIACYCKYMGNIIKMVQPVDTMIDKEYRGLTKRVLVQLFSKLEEALRTNGIDLGFGFPNRGSYYVGKRFLKYMDLIKIESLFKRLSWRLALKRRVNLPFWLML